MQIKVFGPGCEKCEESRKLVERVVRENNLDVSVEKVSDFKEMMRFGVMSTPAVSIDDKIMCTGRVPTAAEVLDWVRAAATTAAASSAGQ